MNRIQKLGLVFWQTAALLFMSCSGSNDVGLVSEPVSIPARVSGQPAVINATCSAAPGPTVMIDGKIVLGGFKVRLTFQNNEKGTHQNVEESSVDVGVIDLHEAVTIPTTQVEGNVGPTPFISIQIVGANGEPLTDEIFLGRCGDMLKPVDAAISMPALAELTNLDVTECLNHEGPDIAFDGHLQMSGVTIRFIFRNEQGQVAAMTGVESDAGSGELTASLSTDLVVMQPNVTVEFPKQPVHGGVGGNPWIYVAFVDGAGNELGERALLGRCVQLSKH